MQADVEKYLSKEMSEVERCRFEAEMARNPAMREEFRAAKAIRGVLFF